MKKKQIIRMLTVCCMVVGLAAGCGEDTSIENEISYRDIGLSCMQKEDYQGAVKAFQNALDEANGGINKEEVDICYYKAAAQVASDDLYGAEATYSALLEYDDQNAQAYFLRGSLYLKMQKEQQANADYEKAISYSDHDFEMYLSIYENLLGNNMESKAKGYLRQALNAKADSAKDEFRKGRLYLLLDDYKNAKKTLKEALQKGEVEANLYLAQNCAKQDDEAGEKEYYHAYAEANKADPKILNKVGHKLMTEEKYEIAETYFEMGLQNRDAENEQELRKNQIKALEYAGDFEMASKKMKEYQKKYPKDQEAAREAVFLENR